MMEDRCVKPTRRSYARSLAPILQSGSDREQWSEGLPGLAPFVAALFVVMGVLMWFEKL